MTGQLPGWLANAIERDHREHALAEYARKLDEQPDTEAQYRALYRERYGVTLSVLPTSLDDDRLTTSRCQRCAQDRRRLP